MISTVVFSLLKPVYGTTTTSVIPLFPCTDGSLQGGFLCPQIMAITTDPSNPRGSPIVKQSRVPLNTQSVTTIIYFGLIFSIGEVVGEVRNMITLDGHLVMQKQDQSNGEELVVLKSPIQRYISPAATTTRQRRDIYIGLGFEGPLVSGTNGSLRQVRNFAIKKNFLILNAQQEARQFCENPEEMILLTLPHGVETWTINVGSVRVTTPADSLRRQPVALPQRYRIDSFSRFDIVPRESFDQLIGTIQRISGVVVEHSVAAGPSIVSNCEPNIHLFPSLQYHLTDDAGNHRMTVLLLPEDYLEIRPRIVGEIDGSRSCELHVRPKRDGNAFTLGVNLFKHLLVYFERNMDRPSQIGFCDTLE
jgi:hypothetical protein